MKAWSEILLKSTDSIQVAIEVLHAGGCRIALVIDGSGKLLGTVTDGDIRRALIKHVNMDFYVEKIMNTTPTTALRSEFTCATLSNKVSNSSTEDNSFFFIRSTNSCVFLYIIYFFSFT